MKNPWNKSPQNWQAYGLIWKFTYDEHIAKRTITADGFELNIKISDMNKFASPYQWFEAWAKKNQKKLPQTQSTVTEDLDLFSSPEPPTITVKAEVVVEELSDEEQSDRLHLERKVERAFYEAGLSLRELRDRRLYRNTHKTFEDYVQDRFCMKRANSYRLIEAAFVVDNLSAECIPMGDNQQKSPTTQSMSPNGIQILPTSERQVRSLTKLEPEEQREAWTKAVESAGGKVPSGRIVKDIVQRIKERVKPPNPYHVGEICRIIASSEPELRGKGGQWCIVSEVHEFSCTVKVYQGEITIRTDNLRLIDYAPSDCEALARLCDRLHNLYSKDLEETAVALIDLLAKLNRASLTPL